jgi:uncharacterized membrane protein YhiD involved in acid resistance
MMNVEIDIWKAIGLALTLLGAFWVLIVLIVKQFNAGLTTRFKRLEDSRIEADSRDGDRFNRLELSQKQQERELLLLKAELPDKYVKREDAIRSEMTLHAKFDGLAGRIDMWLRAKNNE